MFFLKIESTSYGGDKILRKLSRAHTLTENKQLLRVLATENICFIIIVVHKLIMPYACKRKKTSNLINVSITIIY